MAISTPFQWSGNQAITSPEQAARKRSIAEALIAQSATPGQNWSEGLADVAAALSGTVLGGRVDEAEAAGRERAGGLFADLAVNADPNSIIAALTSPDAQWASPAQTSIASALLNSGLERQDPMYQMNMERAQLELDALRNPVQSPFNTDAPTDYQNYQLGQLDPAYAEFLAAQPSGQTINVGDQGQRMGTIPPGFAAVEDPTNPSGYRLEAIPNGPAALEQEAAAAKAAAGGGRRDLATDIITTAATKAREALNSGAITAGTPGAIAANLPESQAAELRRQVDVLKANATIENLTAMRQASPTGGALGSVTEKEGAMLAAASGAIDPNASPEQVAAAIDNYERILLQVVHGPEEGQRLFTETRKADPSVRTTPSGLTFKVLP
jgi:hypothetical protein